MSQTGLPTRIAHGAYRLGRWIILGIAKGIGIMLMQAFIFLACSIPFVIIFGIIGLIAGDLSIAVLGVPVGMLAVVLIAVSAVGSEPAPPSTSSSTSSTNMSNYTGTPSSSGTRTNPTKKSDVIDGIEKHGVSYFKDKSQRRVTVSREPSEREIKNALRANGYDIHYSGPYTGPGPSTNDMWKRAGYPDNESYFMYDYDPVEASVTFNRANGRAGPKDYLSVRVEERLVPDSDGKVYGIFFNTSPGNSDHVVIAEDPNEDPHHPNGKSVDLSDYPDNW